MCLFCNYNVGIRFNFFQVGCETAARFLFGVYSLRNLVLLNSQPTYPLLITQVLRKDGVERARRLARGLLLGVAQCRLQH